LVYLSLTFTNLKENLFPEFVSQVRQIKGWWWSTHIWCYLLVEVGFMSLPLFTENNSGATTPATEKK